MKTNSKITPSELLSTVNKGIFNNIENKLDSRYMTITALSFTEKGAVTFSGQHQDIYIYRAENENVETIQTRGTWMGIFENIHEMLFDDTFTMNSEDCCILFTDGIVEARDNKNEMFSNEKLISIFKNNATKPLDMIKKQILKELDDYTCKDDITLVVLRRK